MQKNVVADYGWTTAVPTHSCGYLAPVVIDILKGLRPGRIVDIGAGNGALCSFIKLAFPGCHVTGVEYDAAGVQVARTAHPTISFHQQGVQDDPRSILSAEGGHFDVAISTEVIEHLFAPELLPAYAAKLLASQGILIVTTPYHGYLKNLALSLLDGWDKHHTVQWTGGHIKFWSRATLTKLLEDHGFEVVDFRGVGRVPWLWKSMVIVARRRSTA